MANNHFLNNVDPLKIHFNCPKVSKNVIKIDKNQAKQLKIIKT